MKTFFKFLLGFFSTLGAFMLASKYLDRKKSVSAPIAKTEPKEEENTIDVEMLTGLNERQLKIVSLFGTKKTVLPSEIYELLPDVSTRTIRRDMDVLVSRGFVTQHGSTRDTKYILKK